MFEDRYNYTQAVAKCSEEGGIIAMAADQDYFNFLFNLFDVYWARDGDIPGVFVDGVRMVRQSSAALLNHHTSYWFCVNTNGVCPSSMPWHPGQPSDPLSQHCASIHTSYTSGVGDYECNLRLMAMCRF